jgi:hypothetical protein
MTDQTNQTVAAFDPMQDPMRPSMFIGSAGDETPAEQVLRKLASWLGVGGYNAPTVDAEVFHEKIVWAINNLSAAPATNEAVTDSAVAASPEAPTDDAQILSLCYQLTNKLCGEYGLKNGNPMYRALRTVAELAARSAAPLAYAPATLSDAEIDKHLDAVLRAAGSALKNYSMPPTIANMRAAMRAALAATA